MTSKEARGGLETPAEGGRSYSAPAAGCAADILLALRRQGSMSLTDLHRELERSKTLVFRVLHELRQRQLVQRDSVGRYRLGVAAFELAAAHLTQSDPSSNIRQILQEFVERTDLTITVGLLYGGDVLYLMKFVGPKGRGPVAGVGELLPANCLALGKALLAQESDASIRKLYGEGLPAMTEYSITDIDDLLAEMSDVRERGYSTNSNEAAIGRSGIGLPLNAPRTIGSKAGFSVSMDVATLQSDQESLVAELRRLREIIEREDAARSAFSDG